MKNFTKLLLGSLVLFSLSGCTAGDMITSYTSTSDQSETTLQNTSGTPKQRVYMDEIKGTLKDFTGATLTMESQEQTYVFDLSEATLECEDGMITGDEISVIYEGQLSNKDTSTVKALKVVDDFHKKNQLEVRKAYGEVQSLTPNTITIKNKKGKTATYPITGTEQYYQNGIRTGVWVYIHFKGKFTSSQDTQSSSLNASHLKVLSISDIDPLTLPDPTPTPDPAQVPADDSAKEQQIHAEIQNISLNTLTVLPSGSDSTINVDLSQTPSYFKGGTAPGSYVTITYTGQFQGNSLDGVTVTAVTGDDPDSLGSREITGSVSGTIICHTANTVTLQTGDGVLKRLGSEALVKRFAVKFLNDPSFQELTDGLAAQDGEKAFRAAHTLKGVCLNLGFTELYKVSAELTEVLRGRETAGSDELYAQVKEQYTTLTDAIRELAGN